MDHPASIGKYELEEFLGGGMSHVYRARDRVLGRTVCIKILTAQGVADQDVRNRFLLEARLAGNFCHDNVVSIYDFGEDNGKPFLVMEYLRGDTLRKLMDDKRVGGVREVLQIALQLSSALECVHAQNIVHRDIKPENVHIGPQHNVKLMDFGIAKARGLSMTQAGFVLGTPYYMAPEQVRGEDVTAQVDVYAFGIMLYELLVGRKPYRAETAEAIFYSILNEPVDPAPLEQANVPPALKTLVLRCVSKDPAQRPQGFGEVTAFLTQIVTTLPSENGMGRPGVQQATIATPTPVRSPGAKPQAAAAPTRTEKKSHVLWWVIAAIVVVAAIGAVVFVTRKPALAPTLTTATGDMILIPGGAFLSGEMKEKANVPAFYIDKTEVSNAAYAAFCNATGCTPPGGDPNLPVVNVTIEQARQFATWAGKRLPKDPEWEKAARGTDGRKFPWGNDWNARDANIGGTALMNVNDFQQGASPFGVLQMAGNAWELVDTQRQGTPEAVTALSHILTPPPTLYEPWVTIRGGSFHSGQAEAVTWEWGRIPARFTHSDIGFRCVKDVK